MDSASKQIEDWILNYLSVPNKVFNGLPPCPYAKQVWLSNRAKVIEVDSDVDSYIKTVVETSMKDWPENCDVVIVATDPKLFSGKKLDEMCIAASNDDYILMWDHPEDKEIDKQGKYAITFIQPRQELEQARKTLEEQGYYKNFRKK